MSLARRLGDKARRAWRERLPIEKVRGLLARRRGVVSLCYHSLAPGLDDYPYRTAAPAFDRHLAFLAEVFDIVPSTAAVEALRRGAVTGRDRPLAVICFDDAYRDNWHLATPILERHGVAATLFAPRDLVRRGGETFLSEAELRELAGHPLWEVGAHGVTHNILTGLLAGDRRRELAECRDWLGDLLGAPPSGFAYPLGQISPAVVEAARELYSHGFTTDRRLGEGFDALQIRRHCPAQGDDDPATFARNLLSATFEDGVS